MMKPIKSVIEVEIRNIKVDQWYYSFEYTLVRDGKKIRHEIYESDHSWSDNIKGFKKFLKEGGAVDLALEQI